MRLGDNMTRTESRQEIIKILYQINILEKIHSNYKVDDLLEEIENPNDFIIETITGITENKEKLESLANKYLKDKWTIDRLSIPDQGILLLGIYELLYTDTPNKVVIDEAINLSKLYSDDDIPKLINGVLDSVFHNEEKLK
jgi:N utilization substance protein B